VEWGLHIRAALLKFAKWPSVLLALIDAIHGQRGAYQTTAKVRVAGKRILLRTHGVAVSIVLLAWLVGWLRGADYDPALVVAAASYVIVSLIVVASEWWPVPAPYDDDLAAERVPWCAPDTVPTEPAPAAELVHGSSR
jgi:hypothetical protein